MSVVMDPPNANRPMRVIVPAEGIEVYVEYVRLQQENAVKEYHFMREESGLGQITTEDDHGIQLENNP